MDKFKIIIAGSRKFNDYEYLKKSIDWLLSGEPYCVNEKPIEIVSGTANGADKLGERYAKEYGYLVKQFPASWNEYGKSAGYIRNKQMAEYADICCVFWDGKSKGSQHMINLAKECGLNVFVYKYEEQC